MRRVVVLALATFALASQSPALTNKVLIIGIDGTMPSALAAARTPNLDLLKSNGCYSVRAVTHPVTHSAACWSSMFTGVWGDKHRVNDINNSFSGNNFAEYPSLFKRFEAARPEFNTLCFARWAPLTNVVPEADVRIAFSSDAAITTETCRRLTNSNPDVFYMILLDVDSAGHSYGWGPTVTNYVRAIETADGRVGQMMSALASRVTYTNENWLVIVLTDHGEHDHPDPEKSRITWQIYSGASAARGVIWPSPTIVDVCATVFAHMGMAIDPAWKLDARVAGLPVAPPSYGTNLIWNGDAEFNSGTDQYATNRGVAWWFDLSSTTLGIYGAQPAFPSPASPGPAHRGTNFFLGGTQSGFMLQRIEISHLAPDIDDKAVDYALSGWFGGTGAEEDAASLTARFLNAAGEPVDSVAIGNVTAADRAGVTGLLQRSTAATVPAGTRFVEFALTNRVVSGNNDGCADNLSFVLTARTDPSPRIEHVSLGPTGCEVELTSVPNRLYTLERAEEFAVWSEVTSSNTVTAGPIRLTDSNAPASRAFYRVRVRRP